MVVIGCQGVEAEVRADLIVGYRSAGRLQAF